MTRRIPDEEFVARRQAAKDWINSLELKAEHKDSIRNKIDALKGWDDQPSSNNIARQLKTKVKAAANADNDESENEVGIQPPLTPRDRIKVFEHTFVITSMCQGHRLPGSFTSLACIPFFATIRSFLDDQTIVPDELQPYIIQQAKAKAQKGKGKAVATSRIRASEDEGDFAIVAGPQEESSGHKRVYDQADNVQAKSQHHESIMNTVEELNNQLDGIGKEMKKLQKLKKKTKKLKKDNKKLKKNNRKLKKDNKKLKKDNKILAEEKKDLLHKQVKDLQSDQIRLRQHYETNENMVKDLQQNMKRDLERHGQDSTTIEELLKEIKEGDMDIDVLASKNFDDRHNERHERGIEPDATDREV